MKKMNIDVRVFDIGKTDHDGRYKSIETEM